MSFCVRMLLLMIFVSKLLRSTNCLERYIVRINVVFWILDATASARSNLIVRRLLLIRAFAAATATPPRPELHAIGYDFGAVLLLAVLLPASGLHATFHEHRASLLQILVDCIGLAPANNAVVEVGLFLLLAITVFVGA